MSIKTMVMYFLPKKKKTLKRVLIVEDEQLMTLLLEESLLKKNYEITYSTAFIEDALSAIDEKEFDIAILDVNIHGEMCCEVAQKLDAKGIPYIFSTGYESSVLPDYLQNRPTFQKPYEISDLFVELERLEAELVS